MMNRGNNKRALSPVVASVLLVALVLVLASIIFLWAGAFIGEQIEKGEKPIANVCEDANFRFDLIKVEGTGKYEIEVVNTGNVPIFKFSIVKRLEGSESRTDFEITVAPQGAVRELVDLSIDGKEPEVVTLYPVLLGSEVGQSINRPYTCTDHGQSQPL